MGMIKCDIHGVSHLSTCCRHIGQAADAKRFERAYIVLDDSNYAHVLCERCRDLSARRTESAAPGLDGYGLGLDAPLEAYCHTCLAAWYEATGQGDLVKDFARARGVEE